ncbi:MULTISPECIES: hypothetical protein [Bacillus]|uniref:hypothetical protein n=1 Tax=Bacillus TaxID=1386 RepID=UPI0012B69CB6
MSAKEFLQNNLVQTIVSIFEETGLQPHLLDIELTEHIAMIDERTTAILTR